MDMYTLLYFKWAIYCIAQGTLFSVMWQPGWEGSLGENGYMYIYMAESLHSETVTILLINCVSHSVLSDSLPPYGLYPARLFCP